MFFIKTKFFNSLLRNSSLVKSGGKNTLHVSTSTKQIEVNSEAHLSKLLNREIVSQAPIKLFSHRVEEETVEVEEIGWAGQPIVKRLHTSLPEVQGDVPDILKAVKKSKAISEIDNNLELQLGNFRKNHDIIAIINENVQNDSIVKHTKQETRDKLLHTKKYSIYGSHSGTSIKKPKKLKKKKRTVVLASKPAILQSSVKSKKHKRRKAKNRKSLSMNQNHRIQSHIILNRLLSSTPFHVESRQFKTYSALNYAKVETSKKLKSSKSQSVTTTAADDCVCPEILYTTGKRKSTKVCGEAAGSGKAKKKSSWKQKMCLVEPKDDHGRKKTFVCLSEVAKQGKRKKDKGKKCPEPEKKIAPKVIICEPILEADKEGKSKKECVKIEEVKIRKKTKVCKPVIIFAKEEVGIQVEKKAVCTSTKIKKVVSRHTKMCSPKKK